MRSIFSGTHPAQTIDRRNVDNVDKENESGGNRIMEAKGLAQKTAKAAKSLLLRTKAAQLCVTRTIS